MFPVRREFEQHVNECVTSKDMAHLFLMFIVGHDCFGSPPEVLLLTTETLLLPHHCLQL